MYAREKVWMGPSSEHQSLTAFSTLPSLKQILLFSATFPEGVTQYAHRFCPNAAEIKLKHNELTVGGIRQMFMDCSNGDQGKYDVLVQLYDLMTIGSSIIFTKVSIQPPTSIISNVDVDTRDGNRDRQSTQRCGTQGCRHPRCFRGCRERCYSGRVP